MDYFLKAIENKIKRFEGKAESKIYYQLRVEYSYCLLLTYFWNKNFQKIAINDFVLQENLIKEIQRPSIGTIWNIIQKLDVDSELNFNSQNKSLQNNTYANLRNEKIGHGFSFEDDNNSFFEDFSSEFNKLIKLNIQVLSANTDFVYVENFNIESNSYIGTIYDYTGEIRSNWKCRKEVSEFELNNLYACSEPNFYYRVSPFIHIDLEEDGLYIFRNVQQPLIGSIRYNRIDKTSKDYVLSWSELEFAATNGFQKKQFNGCVINVFTPNYKKYIDVGSIKEKVYNFLIGKEKGSSVCITLWGHGGNGKTATAQKICEELANNEKRKFDFIIFLSAKDRELNKFTGKINIIDSDSRVTNFEDLIEKINEIVFCEKSSDYSRIISEKSRMLIVIDDYETFEDADKEKITGFIKLLNTNFHKVIITTRNSFLKIGDDIPTNELNISDTKKFLLEVLKNEHNYSPLQLFEVDQDLNNEIIIREIHRLTLGKPIEIIRFANSFIQKGRINEGFLNQMKKVISRSDRIEFLYGRNYDQLKGDKDAQNIFVIIGLLTPKDTLTSLVKHIKLILNKKDEDEAKFNIELDKLVKLRLIEIDDDGSYKVDSMDILEIMKKEYDKRDTYFKSRTKSIYDRIKNNITSDTDRAILNHVKSLRYQSNSETTVQQYKEIIRQGKDFSKEVKYEAFLDLTDFLFNHLGEKEAALKIFEDYFYEFYQFDVLKRYASYCWSLSKEKAINILEEFYSNNENRGVTLSKQNKTHLIALIVLREGQFWNDKYEREYSQRTKNQKELTRIYNNYGHFLSSYIGKFDFQKDFTAEQRNDVILALDNLIDICFRIGYKDRAINLCRTGIENANDFIKGRFQKKLENIQGARSYIFNSSPSKNNSYIKKPNNNLGLINLEPKIEGYTGIIRNIHFDNNGLFGYISVDSFSGKVFFREKNLASVNLKEVKEGLKVKFGFGIISTNKYGAINIKRYS